MIEIKNIKKIYINGKGIIDFSASFNVGDIVGLIGDNGAGKSTLIKSLFNEIKKDSGEFLYNGKDIKQYNGIIAYFPDQSAYPKNVIISDFITYYAMINGVNKSEIKTRLDELLKYFDLEEYKNKKFGSLSAGLQKKALFVLILITNPKYIFLDEPTANLDIKNRIIFIDLLKDIVQKFNKSVLITSHLIDELNDFVNRIIILEDGKKIFEKNIVKGDSIKKIYIEHTKKEIKKDKKGISFLSE